MSYHTGENTMEHTRNTPLLRNAIGLGIALLVADSSAQAYELYTDDDTTVTGNFLAVYGMFNSRKNYDGTRGGSSRSEEHTSELQSLMRISYAVFCLKTK